VLSVAVLGTVGSDPAPDALAVFKTDVPLAVALGETSTCTDALAPLLRFPMLQVTVPLEYVHTFEANRNVTLAGGVFVTVTFMA
jgi:hypothetical protein